MKTPTIFVLLFLLMVSPTVRAQEDNILGAVMEAAAAQENAANQAQAQANSEAQSEAAAAWKEAWEKRQEELSEYYGIFDTKYLKCTAMMVLYLSNYFTLVDDHRLSYIPMSPCDALGMETLALATSTTIMYCPEEMAQLSDEELRIIASEFDERTDEFHNSPLGAAHDHEFANLLYHIKRKFYDAVRDQDAGDLSVYRYSPEEWVHVMKYMIEFFKPQYIIPRTLQIAQEMEAMGCSKPN